MKGLVFDIQGHSVHDGPGGRTLVLLGGCPLRCRWCANPEGQGAGPVLMVRSSKCRRTMRCVDACPSGAVSAHEDGPRLDRSACDVCETHRCAASCYSGALAVSGRPYDVDEVMHIVGRDRDYWGPRGGVTLGGGDPVAQLPFAKEILRRCREAYIHTAIETSACAGSGRFIEMCECVDWAFVDVKHMDPQRHREGTGVDNGLILDNIARLVSSGWPGRLVARVPVIPGFNDSIENIRATATFLAGAGARELQLLPFHPLGESKYRQLGRAYDYAEVEPPGRARMEALADTARRAGVVCYVGHETPF